MIYRNGKTKKIFAKESSKEILIRKSKIERDERRAEEGKNCFVRFFRYFSVFLFFFPLFLLRKKEYTASVITARYP